jgi:hypothetical protein
MSQSADQPGSPPSGPAAEPPKTLSPSEGLPEVKPPDTSFLMQLFVYPLAIVCVIAAVVALVQLVSNSGGSPYEFVEALEGNNRGRWPAAHNLAMAMASGDEEIKNDSQLAARLARILERELDQTYDKKYEKIESIKLRLFLSQALGEFHVDDGLPALLRAAQEQLADDEVAARCTAIGAIARLAANVRESDPIDSPEVIAALLKASADDDTAVIRTSAVALGAVGGTKAIERLKELTSYNFHPSVRYNAAVKLATLGEAASLDVLLEMLDLENDVAISIDYVDEDGEVETLDEEKDKALIEQLRVNARASVLLNALRAASQLAKKNPSVDLGKLIVAIEKVTAADLRVQLPRDKADAIHDKAVEVLAELKK